jgi:hypothetical protein
MKTSIHFWSYPARFFLKWEILRTPVVEEIKTLILCWITFILKNRAVYEMRYKNIVEPGRPQMTVWWMHIACSIPKATNTHSEYAILITFPLQQWSYERTSVLSYSPFPVLLMFRKSFGCPCVVICVVSSVVCSSTFP